MHACREPSDEPVLRFRNYQPKSEDLKGNEVAPAPLPSVEEQVGAAEALHNDATQEPLLNLSPKKANWDLKRDIEPQARTATATRRVLVHPARVRWRHTYSRPRR